MDFLVVFTLFASVWSAHGFSIISRDQLWTGGALRYEIDNSTVPRFTQAQFERIHEAAADLNTQLRLGNVLTVTVTPRVNQPNYVFITHNINSGCTAQVGMRNGVQNMNLRLGCLDTIGQIQHYFLHALGVFNEHRRFDRDTYLSVEWDNIASEDARHFFMHDVPNPREPVMEASPFDFGSIMMYGPYAYAQDVGRQTMDPIDPQYYGYMGQRYAPSELDIEKLHVAYGFIDGCDASWINRENFPGC